VVSTQSTTRYTAQVFFFFFFFWVVKNLNLFDISLRKMTEIFGTQEITSKGLIIRNSALKNRAYEFLIISQKFPLPIKIIGLFRIID
jgi:hypothetical protein